MRWAALGLVRAVAVSAGMGLLSSALATTDEIHWTVIGPTSVTFDWRGPLSENSIQYGLDAGSYTKSVTALPPPGNCTPWSSPGPFWEARLTGLSPDTLYHYSIANGPDHTFRTPPLPGASSFVVLAQADIGESTSYGTMLPVQQLMAQERDARFVLMVGDLSYGRSHGAAKDDQHFNDVMLWSQDVAYMPAWGNNEYDIPPENVDDLRNFEGRFEFANPRSSPGTQGNSSCGEDWYWFDYGNVRFIAYPEPWTGAVADWTSQATPLMDAAQADPNIRFIVTFGHRPAYSSGHHPGEGPLKASLDALSSTHSKYVLNVNGHSHNYERTHPQDGSGGHQNGAVHVTVGTGGSNLEQDGACLWLTCTQPAWSAARFMHLGYLKLYFTPTSIQGAFLCGPAGGGTNDITCPAGSVIDSFSIGPPVCIDPDGDGYGNPGDSACPNGPATDCAPTDPGVYPGASEKNDGHDNQCPGNPGYGLIDETSGNSGFLNATNRKTEYSWPTQSGETLWEVARAEASDFSVGCMTVQSSVANWTDTQVPALGHVFFYLNRPVAPYVGSWGAQSSGVERTGICPATGTATAVGGLVASLDDAEESGTGVMRLNSSDLDLTLDGTYQTVGMRFNGLPIPHGARILNAYVQFAVGDASSASTALKIQGQSADRPSAFTAENGNLSSRSKTSAFASWNPPPWTAGEAGVNQRTPDLSAIVREIVIRPGWVGGDPLVIILTGTGDRSAKAWDYNSGAGAPQLHVAYDGGGVPVCPDPDRDGYGNPGTSVCPNGPATDCAPTDPSTYPGAPEKTDGHDNQCPGNPGYGLIDETSGNSGFLNATNKKTEYSWPTQSGETLWEVARAEASDFSVGCMTVQSSVANWTDTQVPALGHVFFYLNRPVAPYVGSWGAQSSGVERTGICPATGTATAVGGLVASLDDAEESGTGVMRLNSSDLDLTLDGTYQTVGMRFNGLPIPHGARILNAYVQFAVGDASSASTALKIQGQSADRPSAFTAENGNLSSRSKTSAFASWNPPPWTAGEAGVNQRTPDLSAIVREIVIRPGWVGGDPLVIILTGTGDRSAKAWDYNSGAGAPQLHVAYDGGGVPVCPDPDRDGYGNPGTSVCPNGPATDCDTNNQNVYPGAAQICDGLNDDCSSLGWPSLEGTNEFDNDGDGLSVCTGDCNDTTSLCTTDCTDTDGDGACNPFDTCTDTDGDGFGNSGFPANTCPVDCSPTDPLTHPGAPERNDGRDNQCPGDLGYGSIDETTGDSGFHSVTKAKTKYSWPSQQGATSWEVARAGSPDFSLGCGTVATSGTNWTDAQVPSSGRVFYYLNRPASPFAGSWGARSSGVERTGICPAAP